jgi:excisionase family DNA binding protein
MKPTYSAMYLRRDELADSLSVSTRTVQNWSRAGVIPFTKIGGAVLYDPAEVREALLRFRHAAVGEVPRRAKNAGERCAPPVPQLPQR